VNVLVIGGAGYVGSHTVRRLLQEGENVWVYDSLFQGHRSACPTDRLIVGDILDGPLLEEVLRAKRIDAVMHFAARTLVGESVVDPAKYYRNNVVGALTLLDAMRGTGVRRLVFSSTCAVFGDPASLPMHEDLPKHPVSPYGATKLMMEQALADYSHAYGLGYAALRYFNAAGASPAGDLGEDHDPESHLIPLVLQVALGQRPHITIFGEDYPTPDGSCVRDYIHVDDLADAHYRALCKLEDGSQFQLNLGTGQGYSVKQVIDTCRRITGHDIPVVMGQRRAGDPPELVADPSKALKVLGWKAERSDLETIVRDAWRWHSAHPRGFGDRQA
jgi:UDP-glucose-4-epimerase GalE